MAAIHWVNIIEAAGALAATIGVVGGAAVAVMYGRKASVSIAADAHTADAHVIIAARPSISSVGFFRMKFDRGGAVAVRVTESYFAGTRMTDGRHWDQEDIFGASFVEGGETLATTVLFDLGELPSDVFGWRVSFGVTTSRVRGSPGWSWADQVSVPRVHA
jgi:hypothetical protein